MTILIITAAVVVSVVAIAMALYDWLCPPVYPKDDPYSWRDD